LSVDIHKQHSNQVKSVIDVANEEKKILNEHLEKIEKLQIVFTDEHSQLQQKLKSKNKHLLLCILLIMMLFLDLDVNEGKTSQEIDKEFDQIISCVQARRKVLKEQLQTKSKVQQYIKYILRIC
jgi:hypothetical protein